VGGFAAETPIIAAAITSGHDKVSEKTMFQQFLWWHSTLHWPV